jgi:hypothetical protein
MGCPTSLYGGKILSAMVFLVWRELEFIRAPSSLFHSKKNAPTKPNANGWWGRGAPSGVGTPLADYFTTGEVVSVNWKTTIGQFVNGKPFDRLRAGGER